MFCANTPDCLIQLSFKEGSRLRFLFNGVFRQGIWVEVLIGTSIRQVVVDQLGIAEEYLENRIQTLFLNGKPVDDVEARKVSDGSILALSAAMPGLAGATLRKGGKYAAFRQVISHDSDFPVPVPSKKGWMILKLFNQVAEEQGSALLAKGIRISGDELLSLIKKAQDQSLLQEIQQVEVNGIAVDPEEMALTIGSKKTVLLKVI